ncbi:MAG TPA: hypothetical protein PK431_16780, partial [Chitinophagales bacterium]|nr:hypothetical protein [Chitinophagales bacterium]
EMDEVSKLLAKSLTGGMEKIGGAKMQVDKSNKRIQVQQNSSIDMTEMLKNMSGLFSGMVTEVAGGMAEAFGTDTATNERPTKEKIKESKKEIKKNVEKAFEDMEMKVSQNTVGIFDYKNKQVISLTQQITTEGKSEGKNMFDSATLYFDVLK